MYREYMLLPKRKCKSTDDRANPIEKDREARMILFRLRVGTIIYTRASEEGCKVMEASERQSSGGRASCDNLRE